MVSKIEIKQGDITQERVDAIVNAANPTLLGGGGVDGAIHRAAGPELLAACKKLNGCPTGEAKITLGYQLPAKYVIHTPGPVWHGGQRQEAHLLQNSYANSLTLAAEKYCQTIAFPSISTGVYGYPLAQAAPIALKTTSHFLATASSIKNVRFICFDVKTLAAYQQAAQQLGIS